MQTVNGVKTTAAKALLIKHAVALSSAPSEADILFFLGQAIEDTAAAVLSFEECQKIMRLAASGYTPTEAALVTHTEMCNLLGLIPEQWRRPEVKPLPSDRSLKGWANIILPNGKGRLTKEQGGT